MNRMIEKKYIEKTRVVKRLYHNDLVEYIETYYFDPTTNEEVYFKNVEKENKLRYINGYKEKIGLLTTDQIKNIRKKYDLSQREYSFALGLGEITVHRYEKGAIQSFGDNQLMSLSRNVNLFRQMLQENKDSFQQKRYEEINERLQEFIKLENHKVISQNSLLEVSGKVVTAELNDVAVHIYNNYQNKVIDGSIMSLAKLNCMLYFLQGLSAYLFNQVAFKDDFYSSKNGPYLKKLAALPSNKDKVYLSEGLYHLCELIIETYGIYEGSYLVKLSLEEFPYSGKEQLIKIENIKKYFTKVYQQ